MRGEEGKRSREKERHKEKEKNKKSKREEQATASLQAPDLDGRVFAARNKVPVLVSNPLGRRGVAVCEE